MTIRVFMTQLWPAAGGRTRAVFARNHRLQEAVQDDVELLVLERADDTQERICAASQRYGLKFRVQGLFQRLRFVRGSNGYKSSISEIVFAHLPNLSGLSFEISDDHRLVSVKYFGDLCLTFWSRSVLTDLWRCGNVRERLIFLVGNSKTIIGYVQGLRVFRCVLDMQGNIISRGVYEPSGKRYDSEEYFNVFGELLFTSKVRSSGRSYQLYFGSESMFDSANAYDELVGYLLVFLYPSQRGDTLVADEPSLYKYVLSGSEQGVRRFLYFHWYNLGGEERRALTDRSVHKYAVFLTRSQRDDFLLRSGVWESKVLTTVVTDNILDTAGPLVGRSEGRGCCIVSVGRLSAEKNVARTITIFSQFLHRSPGSILVLIGDGPERSRLESLARTLGISDYVVFAGNLLRPYDSDFFQTVDAALLTPRHETYGLVFPELISRGIPVVSVDSTYGPSKWIRDGLNGRLLQVNASDQEVADALLDLIGEDLSPAEVAETIDIEAINRETVSQMAQLF